MLHSISSIDQKTRSKALNGFAMGMKNLMIKKLATEDIAKG
ncbi:hypothetical protein AVDCRST_MAG94-7136 [uncultured Leptolyngbya sp.]|uniref:Uncharacterized protein n=1 Tax=uncultured Leptolyngbya sp. TaxID=332963 RepID=A0A6J4PTI3_9CYAN|nr:hypothetical protein AVDCRST_MAG94-7136 [uncultured Leptolyngbya sp.]